MSRAFEGNRRDWNDLATLDPLYAICTEAGKRGGGWDSEEFFATGRAEIAKVVEYLTVHAPDVSFGSVLDFGCGVGRLSAAMARYWDRVVGVDVSGVMILKATEYHKGDSQLEFLVNDRPDLSCFSDRTFDFVYSNITLMHLPQERAIERYVRDFIRVLKPGGYTLFQLPTRLPLLRRLKVRRHLYHALRLAGAPATSLYRLGLHPIKVRQVASSRVAEWVSGEARVLYVTLDGSPHTRYLIQRTSR